MNVPARRAVEPLCVKIQHSSKTVPKSFFRATIGHVTSENRTIPSQTFPDHAVRPGTHFPSGYRLGGKYVVVRLLGEGGMGTVYLAEDITLKRRVAIKTISPEADDATRSRFLREARIAANLQSDEIVRIHDFGEDEASGVPYFVMDAHLLSESEIEHVCRDILGCPPPIVNRGPAPDDLYPLTLQDVLEGDRALGEVAAARLGLEILDALAALHAASTPIIHRDLKPSNLLFTPSGRLLLADFGISRPERVLGDSQPTLTLGGNPLGRLPTRRPSNETETS